MRVFSIRYLVLVPALLILLVGCSQRRPPVAGPADDGRPGPAPATPPAATDGAKSADNPELPLIVALGDSLTDGQGVPRAEAWPAVAERLLQARGHRWRVLNAGVSGDTSAGGLSRLDRILALRPRILVLQLGANDGLRGLPIAELHRNLDAIITRAKAAGVRVILAGMEIPPNYGEDYARAFREIYPRLAETHRLALIPFLLDGVAADPKLNLPDGVHPNAAGYRLVAENVLRVLEPVVRGS